MAGATRHHLPRRVSEGEHRDATTFQIRDGKEPLPDDPARVSGFSFCDFDAPDALELQAERATASNSGSQDRNAQAELPEAAQESKLPQLQDSSADDARAPHSAWDRRSTSAVISGDPDCSGAAPSPTSSTATLF